MTASTPDAAGRSGRFWKWVGLTTAALSLVLAINQVAHLLIDFRRHQRESTAMLGVAEQQESRGEYSEAWASLKQAGDIRETAAVEAARLKLAMSWLDDARSSPDKPFSSIVDLVMPALDRALLHASGQRRADVLAHIGWGEFLRSRDGLSADPTPRYREALAIDPTNPFANAMLAHWLIRDGAPVDSARHYFSAALAAGRERALVRRLQLASLECSGDEADFELIRVCDTMRRDGEQLDERTRGEIRGVYAMRLNRGVGQPLATPLSEVLPATDQLATYAWILGGARSRVSDSLSSNYVLGILQEAAGQRRDAVETFKALRASLTSTWTTDLRLRTDRALTRLAHELSGARKR